MGGVAGGDKELQVEFNLLMVILIVNKLLMSSFTPLMMCGLCDNKLLIDRICLNNAACVLLGWNPLPTAPAFVLLGWNIGATPHVRHN